MLKLCGVSLITQGANSAGAKPVDQMFVLSALCVNDRDIHPDSLNQNV
jgi:hypothetical protein